MREVHRFIADSLLLLRPLGGDGGEDRRQAASATGKAIAVAGAGPAGLAAAFYLALLGHEVMVFENNAEAGGMLRYALPAYRLSNTQSLPVPLVRFRIARRARA